MIEADRQDRMHSLKIFKVILVGRRPAWCENLSMGYLRAALESAGFDVEMLRLNHARDVHLAANTIMTSRPGLVGLSIPETNSAFFSLALGELLKKRGYDGYITCGGQFATLNREWLLERYGWLDSVVRFAGEAPVVDLATRIASSRSICGVAGLSTREGDGECARVLDNTTSKIWPHRDELCDRLGHKVALMLCARGCKGNCAYCGPAALQNLERDEARRQGATTEEMNRCGVGGVRRRDLDDLCDEMAYLWHERDVRYFGFTDEHFLPFGEADALGYLDRWKRGLKKRKVGSFGLGGQLRTNHITESIADQLAGMGLVRMYAGVDLGVAQDGKKFGRPVFGDREAAAIRKLNALGIATISNVMLVHPYSSAKSIETSITTMEKIPCGMVEAAQMFVYAGTRLFDSIAKEGRLHGNPLRYDYEIDDPVVRRFAEIFAALRTQAFGVFSIAQRAHDAAWNISLARKLHPDVDCGRFETRISRLRNTINSLYVEAYRQALAMARKGSVRGDEQPVLDQYIQRTRFIEKELTSIEHSLSKLLDVPLCGSSVFTTAAASLFSLCLLTSVPGCRHVDPLGGDAGATDSDTDTNSDTDSDTDSDSNDECNSTEFYAEQAEIKDTVNEAVPCFNGEVCFNQFGVPSAEIYADSDMLAAFPQSELATQMSQDVVDALSDGEYPCNVNTCVEIEGDLQNEIDLVDQMVFENCDDENLHQFIEYYSIIINDDGTVAGISAQCDEEWCFEVAECIESALEGLVFPCLAGFEIHMATIIIL